MSWSNETYHMSYLRHSHTANMIRSSDLDCHPNLLLFDDTCQQMDWYSISCYMFREGRGDGTNCACTEIRLLAGDDTLCYLCAHQLINHLLANTIKAEHSANVDWYYQRLACQVFHRQSWSRLMLPKSWWRYYLPLVKVCFQVSVVKKYSSVTHPCNQVVSRYNSHRRSVSFNEHDLSL